MSKVTNLRIDKAHDVDIYVGARIRMLRKAQRVSQMDLAQGLGLTFQQVQKYERGSNRVSASKLFEIAQILKVPIGWFFDGYAGRPVPAADEPANDAHAFLKTVAAFELCEAYLAIPTQSQRQSVLALLRAMRPEEARAS